MTLLDDVNHDCPECGYEWQLACSTSEHVCPRCSNEWYGGCHALLREQTTLDLGIEPVVRRSNAEGQGEPVDTSHAKTKTRKARTIAGRDYAPMHEVARSIETQAGFELTIEKPRYEIPSMDEIRDVEKNGLCVVSTFSGCGGSSLGFRWAGFTSLWSSEFVPEAAETYRANFPDVPLGVQDIREVEPELLMARLDLDVGELDVLEGSPPCASFSMAGKRDAAWGEVKSYSDVKQRTDDLLMEYARLLRGLRPRAFVMENVPGLLGGVAKGYRNELMREFESCGYRASYEIVDSQFCGVPQRRRRAIFIGFRNDVKTEPGWFPKRLDYTYSIRDALPHLQDVALVVDQHSSTFNDNDYVTPSLDAPIATVTKTGVSGDDMYDWRLVTTRYRPGGAPSRDRELSLDDPAATISATGYGTGFHDQTKLIAPTPEELLEVSIEHLAIGEAWKDLAPGESGKLVVDEDGSERKTYFNLVRSHPDEPAPTVTQTGGVLGAASLTHPSEPRKFTLAELRRLCGFPDDFVLTGSYRQGWERLGRAVPPPMMRAVATRVAEILT